MSSSDATLCRAYSRWPSSLLFIIGFISLTHRSHSTSDGSYHGSSILLSPFIICVLVSFRMSSISLRRGARCQLASSLRTRFVVLAKFSFIRHYHHAMIRCRFQLSRYFCICSFATQPQKYIRASFSCQAYSSISISRQMAHSHLYFRLTWLLFRYFDDIFINISFHWRHEYFFVCAPLACSPLAAYLPLRARRKLREFAALGATAAQLSCLSSRYYTIYPHLARCLGHSVVRSLVNYSECERDSPVIRWFDILV